MRAKQLRARFLPKGSADLPDNPRELYMNLDFRGNEETKGDRTTFRDENL